MFPPVSKVNLTHFVGHELPIKCPDTLYKRQQRSLDLQLSADEFICHVEKRSRIENGWNFAKAPTCFSLTGACSSNAEDPKLSLSIGGDSMRNFLAEKTCSSNHKLIDLEDGTEKNFLRKKASSSSHNVIDLEEPGDRMTRFSNSGPSLNPLSVEICPEAKHKLEGFSLKEPFLPNMVQKIPHFDSNSFQEHSKCCQEKASSNEGFRDCGDEIPSDDLSSIRQQFVSSRGLFDLNKALQDDSCCCLDDHGDLNASQQDKPVNLALLDLNINYMDEDIWAPNSEDNSAYGSVVTLASLETNEQKLSCESPCPNSLQKGNNSHASLGSYSDNNSSSGKTQHSVITSDVSDQCSQSQVAENNCRYKSSEVEFSVQEAAEWLIHMSLAHSACDQDSNTKLENNEKPEYSFDSFELNALNLTETNLDDDSASSKPVFMSNADGKDFGAKLRRGRRMKDFQKEILPSLASLSRHEILQDINIMEGALRSRECRKNRGQASKRPTVSNGGRRQ